MDRAWAGKGSRDKDFPHLFLKIAWHLNPGSAGRERPGQTQEDRLLAREPLAQLDLRGGKPVVKCYFRELVADAHGGGASGRIVLVIVAARGGQKGHVPAVRSRGPTEGVEARHAKVTGHVRARDMSAGGRRHTAGGPPRGKEGGRESAHVPEERHAVHGHCAELKRHQRLVHELTGRPKAKPDKHCAKVFLPELCLDLFMMPSARTADDERTRRKEGGRVRV